jgi:CRISPR-associated protein Csd1
MLEMLVKYARDHKLVVEPGFAPKDVRWVVVCDLEGRFLDVVELGDTGLGRRNKGQRFACCPDLSQPELVAEGISKSHFLIDTAEVVALYGDKAKEEQVRAKHEYFVSLLCDAGSVMPELSKLAESLGDKRMLEAICMRLKASGAMPTDKVMFRVGNSSPVETDRWHSWWRKFRQTIFSVSGRPAKPTTQMRCLVTGTTTAPLLTHPKVKGLANVGGAMSGDVLVGFDKDAFASYGLEQSANAAISEEAAYAYRAALNDLIAKHSQRLAGARVVHWFKDMVELEDDPLGWLEEPPENSQLNAQQRASELLKAVKNGQRPDLVGNRYYALTLSGAGGRVMVRDWMEGEFEELAGNIGRWFDDLAIVHRDGERLAPDPKFLAVMGATVRDLKDLPPPSVTKMWQVAVRGEPIPRIALAQAFARTKVDIISNQLFNHARMGLMKAYSVRQDRMKGGEPDMRPCVNEEHPSTAYHCGRLMALLAKLQYAALGDVGAGVVQRYYAAASSTPALVLGRLIRGGQFHLNKLDSGLAHWYEQKIGDITCRLGAAVPPTLTLEEQSLFALGYYQQWVDMRTKKSEDSK